MLTSFDIGDLVLVKRRMISGTGETTLGIFTALWWATQGLMEPLSGKGPQKMANDAITKLTK